MSTATRATWRGIWATRALRRRAPAFGQLREFFLHARAADVPAGAVLFPAADSMGPFGSNYPFGFIHDQVRATCIEAGATCLDLFDLFAKLPDPQTSWVTPFDAHPNARHEPRRRRCDPRIRSSRSGDRKRATGFAGASRAPWPLFAPQN